MATVGSGAPGAGTMSVPRWLADEMVGRLARYLRFVGCDTVYARGLSDDEILARAEAEDRVILTRDRALARRTSRAFLLRSPYVKEQWRAVRAAWPSLPQSVRFNRCTECNGLLAPYRPGDEPPAPEAVPRAFPRDERDLFRCRSCGHIYWEGSHTTQVRDRLAAWDRDGDA
jgi:uncharacterized protein